MTGPHRGRKTSSVKTVKGDVERAFRAMNIKSEKDISSMISDERALLEFVEHCKEKKHLPGTIKTYLGSMIDFLEFLGQCKEHNLNVLEIVQTEKLLRQWKKKFNKGDRLQFHKRQAEDRQMLIDSRQVKNYDEGKHKKKAMQVFDSFRENPEKPLRRSELTVCKEYIMVEVGLANGHRSGVSIHMRIGEYNAKYFQDGFAKIPVWDHKTVEAYGAAPVHLRPEAFNNLKTYVDIMRPKLEPKCDHVLLSWGKQPLQDSDPSKAINKVWKMSGNFEGRNISKNLTMNHLRKSISTMSREEQNPHTKENAALMSHSEKTANIHYNLIERDKACTIGAIEIKKLLRGNFLSVVTLFIIRI